MKRAMCALAFAALLMGGSATAWAGEETTKLSVDMGGCSSCVWIISGVLKDVEGVSEVDVSFKDRLAVVTFDDQETTAAALVEALNGYGYPAKVLTN